ncbi:hypothetical protein COU62_01355 [Candidatus Pacearchaeota archaeon CG10_big_fil_rev_8_21_14_0_10_35_219]|nr:hypothetical protein [Candidatus Pacearchaeota archaeon]OIO43370.1 MAG: hypothetical protein AUJ63_00580 [Candidatus Pacearchaeota archaeon CG1_02_35_32]PIO08014.1 MAG: hypothetical protein COU62_01355 [Candidatus Pacearchaeota archaeon CG10_big_fil_rev_8_21_14_0_10_35_219]PIY81526.1 MAG: hypothetical protein COY79_02195 [Candidatus Pacearchaeota archaeon CG_4_10_14_0_8_um_filter_35_169]PIZ78901.1 MAG: hypothetical protein COY00_04580 [Candidatus Pacearchaeota archaeon CG_4_10_14_0_2_um_filt
MNKRGQFFILAAIIVIAIVSGLAGIANYASAGSEQEAFYDLSREVGFETKRVLDWGVFNEENVDVLTEGFLYEYANYIATEREEVLFVYADEESLEIEALIFLEESVGRIGLDTGSNRDKGIQINRRTGKEVEEVFVDNIQKKVTVRIDGIDYTSHLTKGQNIFFVIIKEVDGERYVATG